jgi:molybdate transport system substrate-binding protein
MRILRAGFIALIVLCAASTEAADRHAPRPLTVFAAASLTEVLQQIGTEYTRRNHVPVRYSFASSSALAKQIDSGAAIDVFMSADQEWMDYLQTHARIDVATRRDVVANRLALVAPLDSKVSLKIQPGFALRTALGPSGRLATGDPDSVPVGKYAKAALMSLNVWTEIGPRLVRADNVRMALAYVARGEVPLGIVYQTDARVEPRVRVVALFPESAHAPITYPVAATTDASPQARDFIAFLASPAARALFEKAGFQPLNATR